MLTQENSIEFLVQCIYTRLVVHATQVLAYPKGYVYYMLLTYSMTLLF